MHISIYRMTARNLPWVLQDRIKSYYRYNEGGYWCLLLLVQYDDVTSVYDDVTYDNVLQERIKSYYRYFV